MSDQQTIANKPAPVLPKAIERSQLIEACRILGLDPNAVSDLRIDVNQIYVKWWPSDQAPANIVYDSRRHKGKLSRTPLDIFERVH